MHAGKGISGSGLDWDAIRREAGAAAREFLEKDWEPYLARIKKLEDRQENQGGADKSWVERATSAHWDDLRSVARSK